jgi:5-methylcytosine-specific restriction endonuclease McrA
MGVLASPIEALGQVAGWSTSTTGQVELAWFGLLAAASVGWRHRLRSRTQMAASRVVPPRVVPPVQRRDPRAAQAPTPRQGSTARRDPIPAQLRFKVLQRDGFRCQYCGRGAWEDGVALHADHVVPVVAGGETNEGSLLTACAACNLGKAARAVIR